MRYAMRARAGVGLVAGTVLILCGCSTTPHCGLVLRSSCTLEILRPECGSSNQACARVRPVRPAPPAKRVRRAVASRAAPSRPSRWEWLPSRHEFGARPPCRPPRRGRSALPNGSGSPGAVLTGPELPTVSDAPRRPVCLCGAGPATPPPQVTVAAAAQETPVQEPDAAAARGRCYRARSADASTLAQRAVQRPGRVPAFGAAAGSHPPHVSAPDATPETAGPMAAAPMAGRGSGAGRAVLDGAADRNQGAGEPPDDSPSALLRRGRKSG